MSLTVGFVSIINKKIEENGQGAKLSEHLMPFALIKPLPMKLGSFVDHFLYQLDLEGNVLAIAMIILEKLFQYISYYNSHKIVFTALVVAYKYLKDVPVSNRRLEKVGLLKAGELFELEKAVLDFISWEIKQDDYESVLERLTEAGKVDTSPLIESEDFDVEDDTDTTDYSSNGSFSELSAFFNL